MVGVIRSFPLLLWQLKVLWRWEPDDGSGQGKGQVRRAGQLLPPLARVLQPVSLGEAIPGAGHRWRIADHTMIGVRTVPTQKWN